ncbi:retinol dehydrogenase 13 [Clohesyomyces aquaticus]|uniref:Retinol dehydrogenase 13 n=1 Tax=Clohesyomyces aquaticus TaxID=1231657 RepID=A0A1Y1YZL1_9PLEO|nr:retinol dehydrogenase 13 [Clohesyomyces aquaticus]
MAQKINDTPTGETASGLARTYASEIKGKVVLTTGVSPSGLGAVFVKAIASAQPSLLILAGRNTKKVQETADAILAENPGSPIKVHTLELDLSSLSAVRTAADTVNGWDDVPKIDVLVNNAGIMAVDYSVSLDGHESQFATNHLGPFLFTNLVMGKILASEEPRIVMVSSEGHHLCPIRFHDYDFHKGETYSKWQAYGQSKTANILMALSLARKLSKRNLLAFSLHPGVINTHLGDHIDWNAAFPELLQIYRFWGAPEGWMTEFPFVTPDEGAATHVVAAFDPDIAPHNGSYLEKCALADPWSGRIKPWATNPIEAERLWKLSEELVGQTFTY